MRPDIFGSVISAYLGVGGLMRLGMTCSCVCVCGGGRVAIWLLLSV